MAQVINTNMMSLMTQNNLNKSQNSLSTSIQRLSTGLRINGAKDDAAGQGISNRLHAQIRGLTQAARNANDGISITQTLESAYSEINNNLQRARELSVQGLNGTNSASNLNSIKKEIEERGAEIDRITKQVKFNNVALFPATDGKITIQVGANDGEKIEIALKANSKATLFDPFNYMIDGSRFATNFVRNAAVGGEPEKILGKIDEIIGKVDTIRGQLGAIQNRFESTISELNGRKNDLTATCSHIEDADYAVEVSNMTCAQILQQAGTAVLSQANQIPQTVLSLLQS